MEIILTRQEVISAYINAQTDRKILNGFVWQVEIDGVMTDIPIYLSSENQFNYKAAYDLAFQTEGASLPFTLKFGSTDTPQYYQFTTLTAFQSFYLACIGYINTTLQDGWAIKDSVDYTAYQSALDKI